MKIALVEGSFDDLQPSDIAWLNNVRRKHGRLHVALWPTGTKSWQERCKALRRLPSVWDVHIGRAKDVLPWMRYNMPEAEIFLVAQLPELFTRTKA